MDSEGKRAASERRSEASAVQGSRISNREFKKSFREPRAPTYMTNGGPTAVLRGTLCFYQMMKCKIYCQISS